MRTVTDDRRQPGPRDHRSTTADEAARVLPNTADETHGTSNLASRPRAGNISTDTRAG
jgi:hypothetical protein